MEKIFVDTSAFYAMVNRGEKNHKKIAGFIEKKKNLLVTTNFIFAETLSLITKRLGKNIAIKFGEGLRDSRRIKIFFLSEEYQEEAWNLFFEYRDKDFDYIDATCFTFMKKIGITKALTLDKHYNQMSFIMLPG